MHFKIHLDYFRMDVIFVAKNAVCICKKKKKKLLLPLWGGGAANIFLNISNGKFQSMNYFRPIALNAKLQPISTSSQEQLWTVGNGNFN